MSRPELPASASTALPTSRTVQGLPVGLPPVSIPLADVPPLEPLPLGPMAVVPGFDTRELPTSASHAQTALSTQMPTPLHTMPAGDRRSDETAVQPAQAPMHEPGAAKALVQAAAADMETLLKGDRLAEISGVLSKLAHQLHPFAVDASRRLAPWEKEASDSIKECREDVGGHLMGGLHCADTVCQIAGPWPKTLRGQPLRANVTFQHVTNGFVPKLHLLDKRPWALKGLFARISWIAVPPDSPWVRFAKSHDALVQEAVDALLKALDGLRVGQRADDTRKQLLLDMRAAIVPAHCSPRIAQLLDRAIAPSSWLAEALGPELKALVAYTGPRPFPKGADAKSESAHAAQVLLPQDHSDQRAGRLDELPDQEPSEGAKRGRDAPQRDDMPHAKRAKKMAVQFLVSARDTFARIDEAPFDFNTDRASEGGGERGRTTTTTTTTTSSTFTTTTTAVTPVRLNGPHDQTNPT